MKKVAFFDFDGTIVAPVFHIDGKPVTGFPQNQWTEYCREHQRDAYKDSIVVEPVIQFAKKLQADEWETPIWTASLSKEEQLAKEAFILNHNFGNLFPYIHHFQSVWAKTAWLRQYRADNPDDKILIIEDMYTTIFELNSQGICGIHVSHIITGLADKIVGLS